MEILSITKNLKNGNEIFFSFIEKSIEIFTGKKTDLLCSSNLFSTEFFSYPELYEDSICFMVAYRKLQNILYSAGVSDFSIKDYMYPDFQRNRKIFQNLNNLIKFREHHIFLLNKMCGVLNRIDLNFIITLNKLLITKYKIRFIKKKYKFNQKKKLKIEVKKNKIWSNFYTSLFLFQKKRCCFFFLMKLYNDISIEKKIKDVYKIIQIYKKINNSLLPINKINKEINKTLLFLYSRIDFKTKICIVAIENREIYFIIIRHVLNFINIFQICTIFSLVLNVHNKIKHLNLKKNIPEKNTFNKIKSIIFYNYKCNKNIMVKLKCAFLFLKKKKSEILNVVRINEIINVTFIKLICVSNLFLLYPFQ